jgi:hypothetical protein
MILVEATFGGPERSAVISLCKHFVDGAAQESNLPSVGLPRLTGFEDPLRRVHLRTEAGFRPRFSPTGCREVR